MNFHKSVGAILLLVVAAESRAGDVKWTYVQEGVRGQSSVVSLDEALNRIDDRRTLACLEELVKNVQAARQLQNIQSVLREVRFRYRSPEARKDDTGTYVVPSRDRPELTLEQLGPVNNVMDSPYWSTWPKLRKWWFWLHVALKQKWRSQSFALVVNFSNDHCEDMTSEQIDTEIAALLKAQAAALAEHASRMDQAGATR